MSTNEIQTVLNTYYQKVEKFGENIFRCEKKDRKSNSYQVFFFDNTDGIKSISPNSLGDYIREKLITDYFQNPGAIQWNYYYTFLVGDSKEKKEKAAFLKNTEFARKFIVERNNLKTWLQREYNIEDAADKKELPQLTSIWEDKFSTKGYAFVLDSNTSIGEGWQFITSGTRPETTVIISDDEPVLDETNCRIKQIESISIGGFRKFPEKKDHEFKKVNLIYGPNGFGKTSLLEAIEAFVCGYNSRSKEFIAPQCGLRVKMRGESEFRDLGDSIDRSVINWRNKRYYGIEKARLPQKTLADSFSQFNFFDSDSGFELAQNNPAVIRESFERVILGFAFSQMDKRIQGYQEELRKGLKREQDALNVLKIDFESKKELLNSLQQAAKESNSGAKETYLLRLNEVKWKEKSNLSIENHSEVQIKLSTALMHLQGILEFCSRYNFKTLNEVAIYSNEIKTSKNKFDDFKKSYLQYEERIKELDSEIKGINDFYNNISRYKEYIEIGAQEKLRNNSYLIERNQNGIKIILDIKSDKLEEALQVSAEIKESFSVFEAGVNTQIDALNSKIKELKSELHQKETNIDDLTKIIGELKQLGLNYLERNNNSGECPLCHHDHQTHLILKTEVERVKSNIKQSSELTKLRAEIQKTEKIVDERKKIKLVLSELEKSYSILFGKDIDKNNIVSSMANIITQEISKLDMLQIETTKLISAREFHLNKGFSERELNDLEKSLEKNDVTISTLTPEYLDSLIITTAEKLRDILKNIELSKAQLEVINIGIDELRNLNASGVSRDNLEEFLSGVSLKLDQTNIQIGSLKNLVIIEGNEELIKVENSLKEIFNLINGIKKQISDNEKTSQAIISCEKEVDTFKKRIEVSNVVVKRIMQFESDLKEILENYGKDNYLKEFFASNENKLMSIYRQIHTPKEFEGIRFNLEQGEIQLKRTETDSWDSVNQISSGQRTALALSIFLAFNRQLKDGPALLMFDDPVALVDDINTLTFLDYLREIVNQTDRQIFFATANEGLAFLFKQKFDYLRDDFEMIQLKRSDQ